MPADPQWAKDRLIADSAEAQRKNGMVPETREVDQFWTSTLERVDRKRSEAKPAAPPSKPGPDDDPGDTRDAAQIIRDEGAELLRQGDPRLERAFARRAQRRFHTRQEQLQIARWRQLLRHPEWRDRAIAVYSLQSVYTPESAGGGYHAYASAAHKLLDDSDKVFGDWRKQRLPGDPLI